MPAKPWTSSAARLIAITFASGVLACGSAGIGEGDSPDVSLVVTSAPESVPSGETATFTASVSGIADATVDWAVQEASGCGAINSAGVYTAPEVAAETSCHVLATSHAVPDVSNLSRVRVVPWRWVAIFISPTRAAVVGGQALTFVARVIGSSDTSVTWSVREGSGCGTVAGGVYASPMVAAATTCHVVATSHADPTKSASATVSVTQTPQAAAPTFSPAVGTYGGSVTVTLASATSGAVIRYTTDGSTPSSSSAAYSAPLALTATTTIRAIAQVAGSRDSAVSSGTYSIAVAVVVTPTIAAAVSGEVLAFTATVTGTSNTAVTWSVEEASCGSVTSGGAYSAPAVTVTTTCHVRATSQADGSRYGRATVTVSNTQDADLSTLAGRAIYFGHQSVGANIMNGVRRAVAASTGTRPTVVSVGTAPAAGDMQVGRWDEGYVGANYDPISKINAFQTVMLSAAGAALDGFGSGKPIAMMKLCFVDVQGSWYASHGDADLFAAYQAMVATVQAQRPNVRLVHFTMPLCWPDSADNARREAYNARLRAAYGTAVFDLARLESTDPSGNAVTGANGRYAYQGWVLGDNCHPGTAGEDMLAKALIVFLAN